MRWITSRLPPGVHRLFSLPWSRDRLLGDVDDEVRFHLEMRIAELRARGMDSTQANREALRRFGDVGELRTNLTQAGVRRRRRLRARECLSDGAQRVRFAIRQLRRTPGFTIAATVTMAFAIGATGSIFGLVDGVLLKSFPYRDPDPVLTIWSASKARGVNQFAVSPADFLDYRAQNSTFTALAAAVYQRMTVTGAQEPERVAGLVVTPSYAVTLGITPALGRFLAPDSAGPAEALIGYAYWQRRFGGAPSVLGQALVADGRSYTIVGVMPAGLP